MKTFTQPGFYDVSLTVTSQAGGCEYTQVQEAYINVYPIPDVGYFAGPQPTRAPNTEITFDGYSTADVVEWFWTFNTFNPLGYSFEQDPVFEFPVADGGIYPVQLQITDANVCVNVVNRQIEIQSMFNQFIPTSFTTTTGTTTPSLWRGRTSTQTVLNLRFGTAGGVDLEHHDPTDAWYGHGRGGPIRAQRSLLVPHRSPQHRRRELQKGGLRRGDHHPMTC